MSDTSGKFEPDPGIFVTKGMKGKIPIFSIFIGDDRELVSDPVTLDMGLDMNSYWLEITYQHLMAAASVDLVVEHSKQMHCNA